MKNSDKWSKIPEELKQLKQWICWKKTLRDGKSTKVPVNARNGKFAEVNDSKSWSSFDQAVLSSVNFSGIGFVFTAEDPYCGIDIDKGIDQNLIDWIDSYSELSQSGNGAHIIIKAKLPENKGRRQGNYEIYNHGRYFVMSGKVITDAPITDNQEKAEQFLEYFNDIVEEKRKVKDDQYNANANSNQQQSSLNLTKNSLSDYELLDAIKASEQGVKFDNLYNGNWQSYYPSQSDADAALLSIFRFWTQGNKEQSIQLFSDSALAVRKKWQRKDYQDRTWSAIDNGDVREEKFSNNDDYSDVNLNGILKTPPPTKTAKAPQPKKERKPWQKVTNKEIREVIKGTCLGCMTDLYGRVTKPVLPLEASLLKAIVTAGCALSERKKIDRVTSDISIGADNARLIIDTAGGQVCNVYAMLAANSASGKDIGNMLDKVAMKYKWSIGTAGSAEGIADSLMKKNNGLIAISEFVNWLDKRHWQNKATSFLTEAFSKGYFAHAFSGKGKNGGLREAKYCYPNIIANIQPEVFESVVSKLDVSTGFLGRFLYCKMPEFFGNPAKIDMNKYITTISQCIDMYQYKSGVVDVPEDYLNHLSKMFIKESPTNLHPNWRRLVNEYGPRFAVMLAVTPENANNPTVTLTEEHWLGAEKLILWFFNHAEKMLAHVEDVSDFVKQREKLYKRIFKVIKKFNKDGARWMDISQRANYGSTAKERKEAVQELLEREIIYVDNERYFIKSTPAGYA